jgi:hypothetical protein
MRRRGEISLMYNVRVPYPFLWSFGGPFYGPFDRRRWPRTEAATAVEEEIALFEPILSSDKRAVLEIHWVLVIEADGGFSLRAEWNHLRLDA